MRSTISSPQALPAKKLLLSTKIPITLSIPDNLIRAAREKINLFYTGGKNCNKIVAGSIVAKGEESRELHNVHWRLNASSEQTYTLNVYSDGSYDLSTK